MRYNVLNAARELIAVVFAASASEAQKKADHLAGGPYTVELANNQDGEHIRP